VGATDRVWTRERARREGVSARRLTGGEEFVRVVPGHYLEACWADDLLSRCACVVTAEPRAVISHWTALRLRGVPVPAAERDALHVSVPPSGARPHWRGVTVHRTRDGVVPGAPGRVPVTGSVRAWCESAALVPVTAVAVPGRAPDLADLVAALDVVVRDDPAALDRVRRELARSRSRRGVALARAAVGLHDPLSESAQESRLRVVLTLAGLPPGAVQLVLRDAADRFVARVDLAYPAARVVVEYDGDHHRQPAQWRADLERRRRIESLGWRVVVVTARDLLGRPDQVVGWVRDAIAGRVA
jgi:hypothetical protein